MDAARRTQLQEDAHLRAPLEIGGYTVRPLGWNSRTLLKRVSSPLVTGNGEVDLETAEGEFAVQAFIYIHAAPLPEVIRKSRDPDAFDEAVLTFAASFPPQLTEKVMKFISGELDEAAASLSIPEPSEESEGRDPNGQSRPT